MLKLPSLYSCKVSIIGLGYVGLPIAIEIERTLICYKTQKPLKRKVFGFDINQQRINELKEGLFIVDEISNNLSLASRNLPNVNVTNLNTLNPINLLKFNSVVIAENCLNLIEEKLS